MDYNKIFYELISLPRGETEWVELKEAKNDYDFNKLGKYFSALSNEANLNNKDFGWLIFGYSEKKRKVVGTNFKNNPKVLHKLKYDLANHTTNRISLVDIIPLNIDNFRVLLFKIPPAPKGIPIAWKGHYYGRDGESLVALNTSEFETIRSQKLNIDWSSFICENATLDDLDPDAINFAREKYKEKNPHLSDVVDSWDVITFLNKAKITLDGGITNTALILLGKPESEVKLLPSIAHQDYSLSGKINVIEKPDELIFTNVGNFFLQIPIEELITMETPPEIYRNQFLAKAMVEIKMIDTIGSGIQRMFQNQRKRFFPMPEYDLSNPERVKVKIIGKVLDPNYTKVLMTQTDLNLKTIALLDKVQKKEAISDEAIKHLRKLKLIEGRKPNLFISSKVAKASNKKAEYIKNRGFDTEHYQKMIIEYLKEFSSASRQEIDNLILDKLPDILDTKQKKTRIKNILGRMSKKELIHCDRRGSKTKWTL